MNTRTLEGSRFVGQHLPRQLPPMTISSILENYDGHMRQEVSPESLGLAYNKPSIQS